MAHPHVVIVGGGVGIADHVRIGDRARLAGLSGVAYDLEGGRDYGGIPARPIREWHKEGALIAKMRNGGEACTGPGRRAPFFFPQKRACVSRGGL